MRLWDINFAMCLYWRGWREYQSQKSLAQLEPIIRWLWPDEELTQ